MQFFLVGGAVRDKLLGIKPKEYDWVVVGASPQEMLDLGYTQVGKDFPVFLHPKTKEEYALARLERKIDTGYRGFKFDTKSVRLEDDLLRRDLTINAIAEDKNGELIDPYGGQVDIKNKILRAVSDAFAEDPVRLLRIARFQAKLSDFTIAPETMDMLKSLVTSGEVNALVPERVWIETKKALATERPDLYFYTLRECGALAVIFPEIDCLFGVPQPEKYHPEIDTGIHTMMVLQQAVGMSHKPTVRFAALVHDLGKGTTKSDILPSHYGHESRGVKLILALCERLKIPNDFKELATLVAEFHGHFHRVADELKANIIVNMLERINAYGKPDRFADFLIACEADLRGRTGLEHLDYHQANFFKAIMKATKDISATEFIKAGFEGKKIQTQIHQARISCTKQVLAELKSHQKIIKK